MQHSLFARIPKLWLVCLCLLNGFLLLSCAVPAAPQAAPRSLEMPTTPETYIVPFDAPIAEFQETVLSIGNGQSYGFAGQIEANANFLHGIAINDADGGLVVAPDTTVPVEAQQALFAALVVAGAPLACVDVGDQAYWAISQAAVAELYGSSAIQDSAVAQLLADCSNIAGSLVEGGICPDCGCIGPMGGDPPQCSTTSMQAWSNQLRWDLPTPTSNP